MTATKILLLVAIVLVVAAIWDTARRGYVGPAGRTWLLVAAIFLAVTVFLRLTRR